MLLEFQNSLKVTSEWKNKENGYFFPLLKCISSNLTCQWSSNSCMLLDGVIHLGTSAQMNHIWTSCSAVVFKPLTISWFHFQLGVFHLVWIRWSIANGSISTSGCPWSPQSSTPSDGFYTECFHRSTLTQLSGQLLWSSSLVEFQL